MESVGSTFIIPDLLQVACILHFQHLHTRSSPPHGPSKGPPVDVAMVLVFRDTKSLAHLSSMPCGELRQHAGEGELRLLAQGLGGELRRLAQASERRGRAMPARADLDEHRRRATRARAGISEAMASSAGARRLGVPTAGCGELRLLAQAWGSQGGELLWLALA